MDNMNICLGLLFLVFGETLGETLLLNGGPREFILDIILWIGENELTLVPPLNFLKLIYTQM